MVPTSRRKNRPSKAGQKVTEARLHRAVADLLNLILLPPAVWSTFPSGWGKLGKATAGTLHASGLKRGMPDIMVWARQNEADGTLHGKPIPWYGKPICLGIELKVGDNHLTDEQAAMHGQLHLNGVIVQVCRSVEDVIDALELANIPFRHNSLVGERETSKFAVGGLRW